MTNTRKITLRSEKPGGIVVYRRYVQKLKKDGSPAKAEPRPLTTHLVIYPNGDYRYFDASGLNARSRISATRQKAEIDRDVAWAQKASLAQLAR